jgi:hypothetical protein
MNEFYLALKMITEPRHSWQAPPEPVAIVETKRPEPIVHKLSRADEKALRNAVKHMAGNPLVWNEQLKLWVPEWR